MSALRDFGALLLACEHSARGGSGTVVLSSASGDLPAGEVRLVEGKFASVAAPSADDGPAALQEPDSGVEAMARALAELAPLVASGRLSPEPLVPASGAWAGQELPVAATELITAALALSPELSAAVPPLPAAIAQASAAKIAGLCFLQLADRELPALPVRTLGRLKPDLETALSLFRAARRLSQARFSTQLGEPLATTARSNDQGWLASFEEPFLSLFRLSSNGDYGLLLSCLRRGEPGVSTDGG